MFFGFYQHKRLFPSCIRNFDVILESDVKKADTIIRFTKKSPSLINFGTPTVNTGIFKALVEQKHSVRVDENKLHLRGLTCES
jgi:hypothetical protein